MSEPNPKDVARLRYGGPPISVLWAWIVIDSEGFEAVCRSPWSETHALVSPDEENIVSPHIEQWCRSYYERLGMTVELRRFDLAAVVLNGDQSEALTKALDQPPKPNAALVGAADRYRKGAPK
jgi:hypothetical protein